MIKKGVSVEVLEPADPELAQMVKTCWPVLGRVAGCKTCGDPPEGPGLTVKCRDAHQVCNQCFERFDRPKGKGCRRRKHVSSQALGES